VRGIEKKIFNEYKQLRNTNELEAQFKYTQQCRSLKTYGVTFFLVKEKMKGKNKLVARLLGVSKESIMRVDEKTKEFLQVYPLECVKKWAASPNTFTLDFGDHFKEPLYTMQTSEGENIARLIAGYIDIIMKRKRAKEFIAIDDDEESPVLEEMISPSKATLMQLNKTNMFQVTTGNVGLPGIIRNGQIEGSTFSSGNFLSNSSVTRQALAGHSLASPYVNLFKS
jgi:talin